MYHFSLLLLFSPSIHSRSIFQFVDEDLNNEIDPKELKTIVAKVTGLSPEQCSDELIAKVSIFFRKEKKKEDKLRTRKRENKQTLISTRTLL